jgi:hypothetical protein
MDKRVTDRRDMFPLINPPEVGARGLFLRAVAEVDRLGTQPHRSPDRWYWEEEQRGSMSLLAELAGHDGHLLRRAALRADSSRVERRAAALLRDATRFAWRGEAD